MWSNTHDADCGRAGSASVSPVPSAIYIVLHKPWLLSSLVLLHRMDSPGRLRHIQRAVTALSDLTAPALAHLQPGEAYLWARSGGCDV